MQEFYRYNHLGPSTPMPQGNPLHGCLTNLLAFILSILICALIELCLGSCTTTRYVEVETVRTDTLRITQLQRDSIFIGSVLHDSVVEKQRGDTIILDRWHTRTLTEYRDRWQHDSIYISTHDTIPAPYPVEKEVPAPLTFWQQLRLHLANAILLALALAAAVWLWKRRTWWLTRIRQMI